MRFLSPFHDPFFGDMFPMNPLPDMRVNVEETEKDFIISAELPGVDPEKIDLDVADNRLMISAEIGTEKEQKEKHFIRKECHYGHIQRSFDFSHKPIDANAAKADFKNGMLTVTFPKKGQNLEKGKKIPINA
ncbi:Hsp20/alpha crystallin family protein [Candidatus Peregrinibacteria bacterium]|nr:Hsp20/alpha crystallin family protein [Candidatus Peregrinibacteria bacterium]